MPDILLTGAGFSRNWGGWLANEVFEYLLGCPEMNQDIHTAMWRSKNANLGFENTLQELRGTYEKYGDERAAENVRLFETMLVGMFHSMNKSFELTRFNPLVAAFSSDNEVDYVRYWLTRFGAIFTLNQDCLLELQYLPKDIQRLSSGRWIDMYSPGLEEVLSGGKPFAPPGVFKPGTAAYELTHNRQPYFKLHGSSNWRDGDSTVFIMGGNKGPDIEKSPLLRSYKSHFIRMISQPLTRIMVVGYGFQDLHINEILVKGVDAGAKMFIVDPDGVDALKRIYRPHYRPVGIYEKLAASVQGASRRELARTFGGDHVERAKIMRFLSRTTV